VVDIYPVFYRLKSFFLHSKLHVRELKQNRVTVDFFYHLRNLVIGLDFLSIISIFNVVTVTYYKKIYKY